MAPLHDQLRAELTLARKSQQKAAVLLLGTILADIENAHIAAKRDLTEADVVDVLRKGIKRRRESQKAYEKGGRAELALQERDEAAMLSRFLPPEASEEEVRAAVRAARSSCARQMMALSRARSSTDGARRCGGLVKGRPAAGALSVMYIS